MQELALWWLTFLLGGVITPGQHPQYTRAHYGGKAVGGSTALSTPIFIQHFG